MRIYWEYQKHIIKKRIRLLNLLINCISARSAPKTLSIKDECPFLPLRFLIIFCEILLLIAGLTYSHV